MHVIKLKKMLSKPQNNLVVIVDFLCYNGGQTTCMKQTSNSILYTGTCVMQEQSFHSETHFFKQKIVQENSALQEGEPTLPPGYLSPLVVH